MGVALVALAAVSGLQANEPKQPIVTGVGAVEMTVGDVFELFGANEWDALRNRFRASAREAAE